MQEVLGNALGKPADSDNPQWRRDVEAVVGKCEVLHLTVGDNVYLPGSPAEAMFVVLDGLLGLGQEGNHSGCREIGVGGVAGEGSVAVSYMPLAVAAEVNGLPPMLVPQVERCFALEDTRVARIPSALYRTYLWRWRGHESMCEAVIQALRDDQERPPAEREAELALLNGAMLHFAPNLWRTFEPLQLRMAICQNALKLYSVCAGEKCFSKGSESDGLCILLRGELELERKKDMGAQKARAGTAFGQWASLMPGSFTCSATAIESCEVLKLPREALFSLPAATPRDIKPLLFRCLVLGKPCGERIPHELSVIEQFLQEEWALFKRLEPKMQSSFCQILRVEKLRDGQCLWKCEDVASKAAIVLDGQVSIQPGAPTFASESAAVVFDLRAKNVQSLKEAVAGDVLAEDAVRSALDGREPLAHATRA